MASASPLVAASAAVVLLAVGCSSGMADRPGASPGAQAGASTAYAPYAGLTGTARTDKLVADAKAEGGELDIYTSNTDIQALVEGFEAAYPGIKVNAFRANSETVLQRVLQETGARKTASSASRPSGRVLSQAKRPSRTPVPGAGVDAAADCDARRQSGTSSALRTSWTSNSSSAST